MKKRTQRWQELYCLYWQGGVQQMRQRSIHWIPLLLRRNVQIQRIKTPAAVEIITDKQIRETGAANMQEALKFSTGIITSSQGPRGLSQGTMTAKAVIRGVEKVR